MSRSLRPSGSDSAARSLSSSNALDGLRSVTHEGPRRRLDEPLAFFPQPLHGIIPLALLLIDRRNRAARAAQTYPDRPCLCHPLVEGADIGMLGEHDRLEVVAAEPPDAAPGGESIDRKSTRLNSSH